MVPFDKFQYIFPPRTEMRIPPGANPVRKIWEKFTDVIVQFKLDGTRNMFYIFPDGRVECWGRHKEQQKLYKLTSSMAAQIKSLGLPLGKFHILDGELLHSKTKTVKDVAYMFDVLVFNGEWLIGATYAERYSILSRLLKDRYFPTDFSPKEGEMYLAQSFPITEAEKMWQIAQSVDYCEGLILKRSGVVSRLVPGYQVVNNDGFMLRVRKPKRNYEY